ncbi:hypothetical protein E2C01_065935 [Portunus trituberculatus]|uniref:Uncharacterized protein n=1 Tax=Portunus trituberculatus TaxID=210409 RepID=A0A5B7HGY0_PORTR|nr:hypothetical protein [Portunus trituberculatus]
MCGDSKESEAEEKERRSGVKRGGGREELSVAGENKIQKCKVEDATEKEEEEKEKEEECQLPPIPHNPQPQLHSHKSPEPQCN